MTSFWQEDVQYSESDSRVIMSGTLEKVSSMKAYGGDLIKYKFKVGRAGCSFSPGRLLTLVP
jgi:hypothetical protein